MPPKKKDGVRRLTRKVTNLSLSGSQSASKGGGSVLRSQNIELLGGYIKLEFGSTGRTKQNIKVLEAVLAEVTPQTDEGNQEDTHEVSEQNTHKGDSERLHSDVRENREVDGIHRVHSANSRLRFSTERGLSDNGSLLSDSFTLKVPSSKSVNSSDGETYKPASIGGTATAPAVDISKTRSDKNPKESNNIFAGTNASPTSPSLGNAVRNSSRLATTQDIDSYATHSSVSRNANGVPRRAQRYNSTTDTPMLINIDEGSSKEDLLENVPYNVVAEKAQELSTSIPSYQDADTNTNQIAPYSEMSTPQNKPHLAYRRSLPFIRTMAPESNALMSRTNAYTKENKGQDISGRYYNTRRNGMGCDSALCCGSRHDNSCRTQRRVPQSFECEAQRTASVDLVYSNISDKNSIHTPSYERGRIDLLGDNPNQRMKKFDTSDGILTPRIRANSDHSARHGIGKHAAPATTQKDGSQRTRTHSLSPATVARRHRHRSITPRCFPEAQPSRNGSPKDTHSDGGQHTLLNKQTRGKRRISGSSDPRSNQKALSQTLSAGMYLPKGVLSPSDMKDEALANTAFRGLERSGFTVYAFLDHSDGSTTAGNANTSMVLADAQKPADYLEIANRSMASYGGGTPRVTDPLGSRQSSVCSDVIGDYASVAAFVEGIAAGEGVGSFKSMKSVNSTKSAKSIPTGGFPGSMRGASASFDQIPRRRHSTLRNPVSSSFAVEDRGVLSTGTSWKSRRETGLSTAIQAIDGSLNVTRDTATGALPNGSRRVPSPTDLYATPNTAPLDRGVRVYNPVWSESLFVDTHKYTRSSRVRGGLKRVQSTEISGSEHTGIHSNSLSLSRSGERSNSSPLLSNARASVAARLSRISPSSPSTEKASKTHDLGVVDELDRMLVNTTTLVVVVLQGDSIVGGITIPLRNITPREMWIELTPVSPVYMESLERIMRSKRVAKPHQLTQMMHINDNTARQQRRKSAELEGHRSYFRKIMSLRMFLVLLSLCSVLCIVVVTASVMYTVTMDGLESSYAVVAGRMWVRLATDVQGELYLPELVTRTAASTFYNSDITPQNSADIITYTLRRSWNETRYLQYLHTNNLFVGSVDEYFYSTWVEEAVPNISSEILSVAIQNEFLANETVASGARNQSASVNPIIRFGNNQTCIDQESYQCSIYNTSDIRRVIDGFNVTERPWFQGAAETFGTFWSGVYTYVNSAVLGVTVAIRIPTELDRPLRYVVGADMSLAYLSAKLRTGFNRQNERSEGYAMILSPNNGEMVAVTMPDPEAYLFREVNCSNGLNSTLERFRVIDHTSERINYVGHFLTDLCEEEGICYLRYVERAPATEDCPDAQPADSDCTDANTAQLFACQPPIDAFVNATLVPPSNVSKIYLMPNKDILSIGTHSGSDLGVVIAVVIPFSDYGEFYSRVLSITVSLGVIIIIVSLIISAIVAQIATKPLVECTHNLTNFSKLDFSTPINSAGINSPLKDIAKIYSVMALMRKSLRSFSKYVPPDVVRLLVKSGLEAKRGGQNRIITSFCTDVVDFTSICEGLTVDQLDHLLGDYLMDMSHIVHDCKGVVDKYIGDSIVAIWNAPEIVVDHARLACEAALLCQAKLSLLRDRWTKAGLPPFYQRIGIHTGQGVVGNIGSKRRLNYTALGTNVDFASKLEGDNKTYGTEILISDVTQNRVKDYFLTRPVDDMVLPGVNPRWCRVYELVTHLEIASAESVVKCESFERAFTTLHDRSDPVLAIRLLNEYREKYLRLPGSTEDGEETQSSDGTMTHEGYVHDKVYELLYDRCVEHRDMVRQKDILAFTGYESPRGSVVSQENVGNISGTIDGALDENLLGASGIYWHQD